MSRFRSERMIWRGRMGILFAASAMIGLVALGSAGGAAGAKARAVELNWTGFTSADAGNRSLSMVTLAGRKEKGGPKIPFRITNWGMGAPVTCTGPPAPFSGYQLFPGYVGAVGDHTDPGSARGRAMPVRKGRFATHAVYNVVVYGIPKRIEYDVQGRFTSPRRVAGTLQVSTLWSHSDGTQTSCNSGQLAWSACPWNTASFRPGPPCAGVDPAETGEPVDPSETI